MSRPPSGPGAARDTAPLARGTRIARALPPRLEHCSSSPEFTAATIPQSLLTTHTTKPGVWGLLRVRRGRLRYHLDLHPPEQVVVERGETAVIEPTAPHHVEVLDADTTFLIEFHRARRGA